MPVAIDPLVQQALDAQKGKIIQGGGQIPNMNDAMAQAQAYRNSAITPGYSQRPTAGFPMGMPYSGRFPQPRQYAVRTVTPWGYTGSVGSLPQAPQAQQGNQYPFQLGLGDYFTPHGPGDAQNVANSTVGANFLGSQWGQVPTGYAPRRN